MGAVTVEPSTTTEKWLHALWSQVLQVENLGVTDDFGDLGGDSLLATRLAVEVSREIGVDFPQIDFFDASSVREQATLIDGWLS